MRRMRSLPAVLIACCAASLAAAPNALAACPNEDAVPSAQNLPLIRDALVCLHNEERRAAGVGSLRSHWRLAAAAGSHARDMVTHRYFDHDSLSGRDPFDRMRAAGYIGSRFSWNAGETIAWASGSRATARSVMDAWLASSGQRETVLAPDFRHIGVGVALGAPADRSPGAAPAVTITVDYGWRQSRRALRRCIRRATKKRSRAARRDARARCHGLVRR